MSYLKSEMALLDFAATLRVHINYERNAFEAAKKECSKIETSNPYDHNYYLAETLSNQAFRHDCILSELESLCNDFMYMLNDEGQKAVSEKFTRVDNFLKKELKKESVL